MRLWEAGTDPFPAVSSTGALLDQFRAVWNSSMTAQPRAASFMLSGQGLGGGVAYLFNGSPYTTLCGPYGFPSSWGINAANSYAYGLCAGLTGGFSWDGSQVGRGRCSARPAPGMLLPAGQC